MEERKCSVCGSENIENYYKHEYSDEIICEECLLQIDGITTATTTHYFLDGEYMGTDDDIDDLIEKICDYGSYEKLED